MVNDKESSETETLNHADTWIYDAHARQQTPFDHQVYPGKELTFKYAQASFASAALPWDRTTLSGLHLTTDGISTGTGAIEGPTASSPDGNSEIPVYTNAALLLSDQCPYRLKCAVFNGHTKTDLKERHDISGSVLAQIDEAMVFLNQHNTSDDPLPTIALREALVNAVLHRDYTLDGPTLISMFDSRVEFVSLGGLCGGLQVNDLLNGVSESRNTWLAEIFESLKLSSNLGTGMQRILDLYSESAASPQVRVGPTSVAMILPKPVLDQDWPQPKPLVDSFGGQPGILFDNDHGTDESVDFPAHSAKRYIFPPARRDLTHDPSAALAGARVISASPLSEAIEPLSTLILAGANTVSAEEATTSAPNNTLSSHNTPKASLPSSETLREVEALEQTTLHLLAEQGTLLSRAQIEQTLSLDHEQTAVVLKALVDKGALDEHVEYSISQP
jgi:ATP-dependent DNA helicase RecG